MIDKRTKIYLVDPDKNFRKACEFIINGVERYIVIGSYDTLSKAHLGIIKQRPDLIIVDAASATSEELFMLYKWKVQIGELEILVLSAMINESEILNLFSYGIQGYIVKSVGNNFDILLDGIDKIHKGGSPLSRQISKLLIERIQLNSDSPLSRRELDVLKEMAVGKSYTKIANTLCIGGQTVKSHIKSIYSKLNVNSKHQALALAKEEKWI